MGENANTPSKNDKLEEYIKNNGDITINGSAFSNRDKTIEMGEHVNFDEFLKAVLGENVKMKVSSARDGEKIPLEKNESNRRSSNQVTQQHRRDEEPRENQESR